MGYPTGPLLKVLAERIRANMAHVHEATRDYDPKHSCPPFSDTQLLISLVGVLVFPHERASDALGNLMASFQRLTKVVQLRYCEDPFGKVFLSDESGEDQQIDPQDVKQLARLLRHSIAHFNIRPIEEDGQFAGIRVWNERNGRITMVADLSFKELRPLAEFVLENLAASGLAWEIEDPEDPLKTLRNQGKLS